MSTKKTLPILLLFFVVVTGYSTIKKDPFFKIKSFWTVKDSVYKKNQFKIAPLRIVRWEYTGLECSYERRHTKRLSSQISLRYITDPLMVTYITCKGAGFSIEEKFFFKPRKYSKPYISLEVVADKYTSVESAWFIHPDSLRHHGEYRDTFTAKKQAVSLNLKCGVQFFIFKKIVADIGIGPGLKYRDMVHKNRSVPTDVYVRYMTFSSFMLPEGRYYCENLSVTIRIGYAF